MVVRLGLSLFVVWLLSACQPEENIGVAIEQLSATAAIEQLQNFADSDWRGCELAFDAGVREAELLDGSAGLPFFECRGLFENTYSYEFILVFNPNNPEQVLFSQLEFRRGHQDSFNALLRYFLRLQGIQDEQVRFAIRSQVTSIISSNPRRADFTPIMFLPDGRQIELAHNYPKSAFSTLRVKNELFLPAD